MVGSLDGWREREKGGGVMKSGKRRRISFNITDVYVYWVRLLGASGGNTSSVFKAIIFEIKFAKESS